MSLANQIKETIEKFPEGSTFTYADLDLPASKYITAAKALERLQKKEFIKKLSKGIFYKPKQSVFGELKPGDAEVVKTYLFQNGKRVAYLTGTYLYNQMMLTTQVPNTLKIASFNNRIFVTRQNIQAKPVKAYAPVTDKNYKLLGFLDALKDWNNIPDLNPESGLKLLLFILKGLSQQEVNSVKSLAKKYPPRVRAFLGVLFDELGLAVTDDLLETLNPLTKFKVRGAANTLSKAKKWNVI